MDAAKVTTKFYLRNPNSETETPIIISVHFNGNRYRCKTGLKVLPQNWDKEKSLPLPGNTKLFVGIAKCIDNATATYNYFLHSFYNNIHKDVQPTEADFANKFYEVSELKTAKPQGAKVAKKLTFFEFVDRFINEAKQRQNEITGARISPNTILMYNQCKRLLTEFNATRYKIEFKNLNLDLLLDFKEFLNSKQYSINTVAKHIITLKTFLNDAHERGLYDSLAHKSKRFRATQVQSDTVYLTEAELEQLHKIDLSKKPSLDRARDLFLVGCYTGLRFSDYTNIQPENIKGGFIEITTQKTGQTVVIPIHPRLNEIMSKYEGKFINCLPPAISNQKFNQFIKEVCKLVDVLNIEVQNITSKTLNNKFPAKLLKRVPKYELVSSHTARRSFATNNYNKGISANVLMKITGHKTEKSFYKYIRVTPKENAQRLRDLWQLETSHLKVV